jgi:hypothetical protein
MNQTAHLSEGDIVLESAPDDVLATVEVRDKFMARLGLSGNLGLKFLVNDLQRWTPGQRLRAAFLGGTSAPSRHRRCDTADHRGVQHRP